MKGDQIIIGTTNDEIRRHALKNQWNLSDLIQNGRQLKAAARGANRIKSEEVASANVNHTKRPGKYSKKWKPKGKRDFVGNKQQNKLSTYKSKSMCSTCSFEFCKGGKRCPGSKVQCFDCQKYGHFRGSAICTGKKNKKSTRRIDCDSKTSSEDEESQYDSSDSSPDTNHTKLTRHVTKVRRMRIKRKVRKA